MVDCPNPDCREDLIKKINTKTKDVRDCVNTKVSTKALISVFVIVLSAIGIVSGISYTAYSRGQDEKQKKIVECEKSTQKLATGMAVMQKDIEVIKEQLEKQGVAQDRILGILLDLKARSRSHPNNDN